MDLVISFPNNLKSKIMAKIESDKYEENSFGKKGYIMKDGAAFGLEGKTLVYVKGVDNRFIEHTRELLKDLEFEIIEENKAKEIVKAIQEEEEQAQQGFGSIFG